MDKVSIVIPVYNTKKEYLDECINSVVNQTYKDLEIIIVDDGSKKETSDLCDSYKSIDNRIIVEHKKNEGVSVARNFGIKIATGKWISFVDSDDYLELDAYEKMVSLNDSDVVISKFRKINDKSIEETEEEKLNFEFIENNENKELLIKNILYPTINLSVSFVFLKLYKRDFLIKNNLSFSQGIPLCEDGLFNMQVYDKSKSISIVNRVTYNYRLNDDSVSVKYNAKCIENTIKLLEEYKNDLWNVIENRYKSEYYCFAIWCLNFALIKQLFHIKCDKPLSEKLELLKKTVSEKVYSEAIENVDLAMLSFRKKILVILIRRNFYKLLPIIYRIK